GLTESRRWLGRCQRDVSRRSGRGNSISAPGQEGPWDHGISPDRNWPDGRRHCLSLPQRWTHYRPQLADLLDLRRTLLQVEPGRWQRVRQRSIAGEEDGHDLRSQIWAASSLGLPHGRSLAEINNFRRNTIVLRADKWPELGLS